jgi:hypothetical protein
VGIFPLALGSVMLTRFDLWPAMLSAAACAALAFDRERSAGALLAAAVAAKVYPVLLLPLAVIHVLRQRGRAAAWSFAAAFFLVLALLVGPFVVWGSHGIAIALRYHAVRPLQIESIGSALLLWSGAGIYSPVVAAGFGSHNLMGSVPERVASVSAVLQVLTIVMVWIRFWKTEGSLPQMLTASAAVVAAGVALGKVLSPQFLIWLVPLVASVSGRHGRVAGALLIVAMLLTQLGFPSRYEQLVALDRGVVELLLARDLTLLVLAAVLIHGVRPEPPGAAPSHSPSSRRSRP